MGFGCDDIGKLKTYVESKGLHVDGFTQKDSVTETPSFTLADPDGIPVRFAQYTVSS